MEAKMSQWDKNQFGKREISKRKMLNIIRDNLGINPSEIVKLAKEEKIASEPTVYSILDELEELKKITRIKKPGNKKKVYCYLTEEAIRDPSTQARIIYRLLRGLVRKSLDQKKIYEKIEDKNIDKILEGLKDKIISDEKYEEEKEKYVLKNISHTKKKLISYLVIIDKSPGVYFGFREEELKDMSKEELKEIYAKVWLIGGITPGPLLKPKVLSTWKVVLSELIERSITSNNLEERELYGELIKDFGNMGVSYYKSEPLEEHEEEAIIQALDELLSMDLLDRYYKEYTKTLDYILLAHAKAVKKQRGEDDYSLPI